MVVSGYRDINKAVVRPFGNMGEVAFWRFGVLAFWSKGVVVFGRFGVMENRRKGGLAFFR